MSELRRWSEEGATEEEQWLIAASRRERPDLRARKRTLQALGVGAALTTAATAAGAGGVAGAPGAGGVAGTMGGLVLAGKIIGLGLVVGGISVSAMVWRGAPGQAPASAPPAGSSASMGRSSVTLSAPTVAAEAPSAREPASQEALGADPPPTAPTGRLAVLGAGPASTTRQRERRPVTMGETPKPHALPAPSLSQEVAALERAHDLAGRDPDGALRELDRYRERFRGGALSAEETVLRVEALLAHGDEAKARALAETFSARYPGTPYARRIQDLVCTRARKK